MESGPRGDHRVGDLTRALCQTAVDANCGRGRVVEKEHQVTEKPVPASEVEDPTASESPARPSRDLPRLEEFLARQATFARERSAHSVEECFAGESREVVRREPAPAGWVVLHASHRRAKKSRVPSIRPLRARQPSDLTGTVLSPGAGLSYRSNRKMAKAGPGSTLRQQLVKTFENPSYRPPPLPTIAIALHTLAAKEDAGIDEVVRLLEKDEMLAGTVVRLVASPLYAGRGPVKSLREAVIRMGVRTVRDAVFDAALRS